MAPLFNTPVPLEILHLIVCLLDPVALIALSQASRSWRALISPTCHEHAQRLLALELDPAHGGLVPLFNEHNSTITPSWNSVEWKTAKYACCGCMRLRTHMMFDNHAILRRPFRKPPPGSIAAARAAITDWEPLEPELRRRRIHQRASQEERERREFARVQARRSELRDPPPHPFARVASHAEDEQEAIDRYLTGTLRHKRRCVECQRQRGDMRRRHEPRFPGLDIPRVISRQLRFSGEWERNFPGLVEPLPPGKQPREWRALRESSRGILLSLYLVPCSSCGKWQEHSAFRQWHLSRYSLHVGGLPSGSPPLCARCHLDTHRDPAVLAQELQAGALDMFRLDRKNAISRMTHGWRFIYSDFNGQIAPLRAWKEAEQELLGGLKWAKTPGEGGVAVAEEDFPDLRRRVHRYRELIYREVDPETRANVLQSWFQLWVEDYDRLELLYHWLSEQIAKLERDPMLVLNYVLEREPYLIR